MTERHLIDRKLREHYDAVWSGGDAWEFETSAYEQARFQFQTSLLSSRRYERTLEIGCGSGCFTRSLATLSEQVIAMDISSTAIERAQANAQNWGIRNVTFQVANAMEFDWAAEANWDLVVLSETIYCLGWLYSFFDVASFAANIRSAMDPGGRVLLANTYGGDKDWLMRPWLINTYRDLFCNVGFDLETEEVFRGVKHDHEFEVLMSVFRAP